MSSNLYETLKQTATGHVHAYESPDPFSNDEIQKFRTPECVHYLHPTESIPSPFNEAIKLPQFTQFMALFGPVIENLIFEIKDLAIDTESRLVVARLKSTYDFKAFGDEPEEKGYTAEYMWMMEMEETGTKIVRVEEFMDVQRLLGYVEPKAERYLAWLNGQQEK